VFALRGDPLGHLGSEATVGTHKSFTGSYLAYGMVSSHVLG